MVTQTLLELKCQKAFLRRKMNDEEEALGKVEGETLDKYVEVVKQLRIAEEKLLKPLGECECE